MTLKLLMQNTSVAVICKYFHTKSNLKHTSGMIILDLQAKCELIKSNDVPNTLKHTAIAPCKRYNVSLIIKPAKILKNNTRWEI